MMLLVTGVAGAIHIYSWGYMRDDRGFSRYFACLSLFTFSMLGIVLANNPLPTDKVQGLEYLGVRHVAFTDNGAGDDVVMFRRR